MFIDKVHRFLEYIFSDLPEKQLRQLNKFLSVKNTNYMLRVWKGGCFVNLKHYFQPGAGYSYQITPSVFIKVYKNLGNIEILISKYGIEFFKDIAKEMDWDYLKNHSKYNFPAYLYRRVKEERYL